MPNLQASFLILTEAGSRGGRLLDADLVTVLARRAPPAHVRNTLRALSVHRHRTVCTAQQQEWKDRYRLDKQ